VRLICWDGPCASTSGLRRPSLITTLLLGDLNEMSKGVTYAGLVYLAFSLLAMFFWVRGIVRGRPSVAYAPVQ
jgi:hypothetical protein